MKRSFIFLLIAFLTSQLYAFSWSDLWFTPDQQGQELMKKAEFAKAKERFQQKDWLAAAAYKSGNYQEAASLYEGLKTEKGYYNQGNALAHLHQYEKAIKAYNKAIALNAKNQDALFNRKLVEELLKKEKENKDQQNKDQQNKDQQNKDQQNKDQQNKDQQNKDQQNKDQQNKDQQNKDQQNKDQQNKDQQNNQQNKDQQNKDQQNKDQQNKNQENKDQKDAEKKDKNQVASQAEMDKEKQQAKEQWLRLIPDDPGGLMREKFLRDHLRRERGWEQ